MARTATSKRSEAWFQAYAAEREWEGAEDHEPDLGGSSNPDFRVSREGHSAICEVKAFERSSQQDHLAASGGSAVMGGRIMFGPTRNKLLEASKQLRPYADSDDALLVVLANPKGLWLPMEDPQEMIEAMYGDLAYVMNIDKATGEQVGEGQSIYSRDGVYGGGLHRHVSGVVTLHRRACADDATARWVEEHRPRWTGIADRVEAVEAIFKAHEDPTFEEAANTPGIYYFARVFETPGALSGSRSPDPVDLFDGPHDEIWAYNHATGTFGSGIP